MHQHIWNCRIRRSEEKGAEKIVKEIMIKNFQNLVENYNIDI